MAPLDAAAVDGYLERVGVEPAAVRAAGRDVETLARLQTAHATHVPFENLSIVGDPFADGFGPGVTLDLEELYEKIVVHERGGYCFEVNGLFTMLLEALGFDVHRAAAMVLPEDGEARVPANHHVIIADLDRPYVVDVGTASPQMHRPTPLDGEVVHVDPMDVRWRVVGNDRPAYDRSMQYRVGDDDWETRYVFNPTPRELTYFHASCDFLASSPESPFTGDPIVMRDTEDGWLKLGREVFIRVERGDRSKREIARDEWYDLLEREFDLTAQP